MRRAAVFALALGVATAAQAGAITSEYTDIDLDKTCKVLAKAEEGEGDWVDMECAGYKDYKVHVLEDDLRQSINYGPKIDEPAWESFGAFNHAAGKIEWRLDDGVPFATIHRWSVSDAEGKPEIQVLVVEKVGQTDALGGCAVALVRASGNPQANEQARKIADEKARAFDCGKQDAERLGTVPDFGREMR